MYVTLETTIIIKTLYIRGQGVSVGLLATLKKIKEMEISVAP